MSYRPIPQPKAGTRPASRKPVVTTLTSEVVHSYRTPAATPEVRMAQLEAEVAQLQHAVAVRTRTLLVLVIVLAAMFAATAALHHACCTLHAG